MWKLSTKKNNKSNNKEKQTALLSEIIDELIKSNTDYKFLKGDFQLVVDELLLDIKFIKTIKSNSRENAIPELIDRFKKVMYLVLREKNESYWKITEKNYIEDIAGPLFEFIINKD